MTDTSGRSGRPMAVEAGPDPEATVATLRAVDARNVPGAQTGDAYEQLAAELFGFLVRTVRDPEAAADLLADLFTRLLLEERRGQWPDRPRGWLYRVATNLAMSRGRHLQVVARVDRALRSEERRVGKECRSGWGQYVVKKKA